MDHWTDDVVAAVQRDVRAWQESHPRATFAEIELAAEQQLARVRTQLVEGVIDRGGVDEHPACLGCGATMVKRSQSTRTVVMPGDERVSLHRRYVVCPACGTSLSPLDERCGVLPSHFSPYLVSERTLAATQRTHS